VSYILAIETAVPEFKHFQKDVISFYQNATNNDANKRKIKIVGEKAAIDTRYSVISDFSEPIENFKFFPKHSSLLPEPSINQRMDLFKKHALNLSLEAIKKIKNFESIKSTITNIITVTCTGLYAPGLDIEIINALNLSSSTERCGINFMGCNAAILALKYAHSICKTNTDANVLIVCTELSTIHFQTNFTDDYLVSTALFGDGCAVALVSSNHNDNFDLPKTRIQSFNSKILSQGNNDMAWNISEKGFILNLSSYVSQLINSNIKTMLDSISIKSDEIDYWAIHPGGKKILDDFKEVINLPSEALKHSYDVLRNYGNMSSPTVLFVLKQMLESNKKYKVGEKIFTAAFGPGLSIETMQLEYV
jgi:predicted naringenin-chalcone synthase